ncbi:hypothetical protein ABMA79_02050 [Halobacteriovorax sp. HFRX-2_2]|uniref:hypothetical protein n=1 Tax=unclassified Halobacteriovorax TaxID=2639665 RepID=UPI00370FC699
MKNLILFTFLFFLGLSVNAEVTVVIDGTRYFCSEDGRPPQDRQWQCVAHCDSRSSDGECRRYREDFCGINAVCIPYCETRSSSGVCRRYGDDICRSED